MCSICMRILHDGARLTAVIAFALAAPEDMRPVGKPIWLTGLAAPLTCEPGAPADRLKVSGPGGIIGKEFLELRERAAERQIIAIEGRRSGGVLCPPDYQA
jgi:hypothetical protein